MCKYTSIHVIYTENCDQCEYQGKHCLNLSKCVYNKAFSFILLITLILRAPLSWEQLKHGCAPQIVHFKVQCLLLQGYCLRLTHYCKDSGDLTWAPLFHSLLSLMWATCPALQRTLTPEGLKAEAGGWAVHFPDWLHMRHSVLPIKCEKSPDVVNVTCVVKGEKQPVEM